MSCCILLSVYDVSACFFFHIEFINGEGKGVEDHVIIHGG